MERTRLRRILLTATVALLVATAGCSGLTGGDDTTDNGDGTSGAGYGVAGSDLDGQTLTDAASDAIESGGSVTVETTSTTMASQGNRTQTATSTVSLRVDLDDNRGIRNQTRTVEGGSGTQEQSAVVYTTGNTSYRKQTTGGETTYDRQDSAPGSFGGIRPVDTDGFDRNYTAIVDGFAWEQAGSSEIDGVEVTEYSLTGEPDADTLGLGENTTVENASGTLSVTSDGVIRQIDIAYTVETEGGSASIDVTTTLSNVGSTTVEEPGWLSEAN